MWCPSTDRTACWRKSGNPRCRRNRCWLLRRCDDCPRSLIAVKIEVYGSDAAGSAQEPIPWGLYDWVSASSPHLCSLQKLWKTSVFRAACLDLCAVIKRLQLNKKHWVLVCCEILDLLSSQPEIRPFFWNSGTQKQIHLTRHQTIASQRKEKSGSFSRRRAILKRQIEKCLFCFRSDSRDPSSVFSTHCLPLTLSGGHLTKHNDWIGTDSKLPLFFL